MLEGPVAEAIAQAIAEAATVRLVYKHRNDETVSIHEIAPIDLRPGDTDRTARIFYLWAWCLAEDKLESHIASRILKVIPTGQSFDAAEILARWAESGPLPDRWVVPRTWGRL